MNTPCISDGAPVQSVNVLLSMAKVEAAGEKGNTSDEPRAGGGKKKKRANVLMRPVICICNDPWKPALRQLRQVAFLIHFPQTMKSRCVPYHNCIVLQICAFAFTFR